MYYYLPKYITSILGWMRPQHHVNVKYSSVSGWGHNMTLMLDIQMWVEVSH